MTLETTLEGFTRRKFINLLGGGIGSLVLGGVLGSSTGCACSDVWYENSRMVNELNKVYPLTKEITKSSSSVEGAVEAVIQWSEKNFFHYYKELEENYGVGVYGANDVDDYLNNVLLNLSVEDVFRERAVGCHLATFVMATMLRSIGISAEHIKESAGEFRSSTGHGVLYIPKIDKYVHGDLIADLVGTPAVQIMQTEDELRRMSSADGSYISFNNELFERYWLRLHRSGNNLYVYGVFGNASEKERNEILDNLSEYNLTLQPKINGYRQVNSNRLPIVGLKQ